MALTLALSMVDPYCAAGKRTGFLVTVTNAGASSVTLANLLISETTESDAQIGQPNFITPNVAFGLGNPTILPGASASYGFACVFPGPATPGPSPNQNAVTGGIGASGAGGMFTGQPADPALNLQAQSLSSDNTTASINLVVVAITATPIFPQSLGGSLQFTNPFNAVNLL